MNQTVTSEIIDGDGHIMERDEEIYPYMASPKRPIEKLRRYYLFPDLDGVHRPGAGGPDDPEGWLGFLDRAGLSETILYPTAALGFAFAKDPAWAIDLARAYNDYVHNRYLKVSPRFKAIALIPVQDPPAAAKELRRAVTELGMVGGLLPAPGLPVPYGDRSFDVLYEEAQALGTMLGVHGASYRNVGLDFPMSGIGRPGFGPAHPAQPITQMIQFINMICERVFERYPRLKVAFLEAGCGWVAYWVDRIDGRAKQPLAANQVRNSPLYFHAELEELDSLRHFSSLFGEDRLVYASDYPHAADEEILENLQEFLQREDVGQSIKQKLLCDNIKALYVRN